MSFNATIPQLNDPISLSQGQCKANFQAMFTAFAQNHANFNSANPGQHNTLTMHNQSGDPTTGVSQVALYNKIVSSTPEIFFMPQSSATPIQLTYPSISTIETGAPNNANYSFVAGPFVIYSGFLASQPNNATITLTPTTTLIYAAMTILSTTQNVPQYAAAVISGSGFTVKYPTYLAAIPPTIYYFAIGK